MEQIIKKAYGKINLGLDVLGRREDGYHLLRMVMQTVDIADTLTISRIPEAEIRISVDSDQIPDGKDNLIYRAAKRMFEYYELPGGVGIRLEKKIPVAAGMAGGSTDAAAVFSGIRELFELPISVRQLQELALPLGADIPYCLEGGTKLAEGIGEILTPLPAPPECFLLIVKPDLMVPTGWVYKTLDERPGARHPDVDGLIGALREHSYEKMLYFCGNILEDVTAGEYPVIGKLESFLMENGADQAKMTGSGPTVFAFYREQEAAVRALEQLKNHAEYSAFQSFVTVMRDVL